MAERKQKEGLDPVPFFAEEQEAMLNAFLEHGYSLTQRRKDGVWVRRTINGETELDYRDD